MNNIFAIAKNTFRETARDRILLSAFFVIIAIILFTLFIASISLGESTRMIIDFSSTAIYLLQIFVAVFIGSMLIYKEIDKKTFFLLLPKPITRTEIVVGKCLGLSLTTLLVTLLSTSALFLILFIESGHLFFYPIILSVFLSMIEAVILILISILFSGITSPLLAAVSTLTFFFVGHAGAIFERIFMTTKIPIIEFVTKSIYYILPNLEKFNIRNDIVYGTIPSPSMIVVTVLYGICYVFLLLSVTQMVFKKKDF